MVAGNCPICSSSSQLEQLTSKAQAGFHWEVRCHRCGQYLITDNAKDDIENAFKLDNKEMGQYLSIDSTGHQVLALFKEVAKKAEERGVEVPRSIISHVLRKRTDKRSPLTDDVLASILKNNSMLTPAEQANNLITFIGHYLSRPGDFFQVPSRPSNELQDQENIFGLVGIKTGAGEWRDLDFIITALGEQKILNVVDVEVKDKDKDVSVAAFQFYGQQRRQIISLTFEGWQKYEELQRSVNDSRKAFVAMEFPNPEKTTANYFFQNVLLDKFLVPL